MDTAQSAEIGYGSGELAFILTSFDHSATAESARALGMDLAEVSDEVRAAGASSLMAKGCLDIVDGQANLSGVAEILGYTLAAATRWTELGFFASRDEMIDGALVVSAPEATTLMQPRALGAWMTVLKDPAHSDAAAVRALIEAFASSTPGGVVFLATRANGQSSTVFIRTLADGRWEIVEGEADAEDGNAGTFDHEEADRILERVLNPEALL